MRGKVLITGAKGFIGRHLVARLSRCADLELCEYDVGNSNAELHQWATAADVVFHLAGVNRPQQVEEFETGNAGLTNTLCTILRRAKRSPRILLSSSIQAALDNPYGVSKRHAEIILGQFAEDTGAHVSIFRLKNVFGPGCRPNYNSVTATFCHHIANDLPIQINDANYQIELVHVDDVVSALVDEMNSADQSGGLVSRGDGIPSYALRLGDLAGRIQFFHEMQHSLQTPDFSIRFNQQLYATYLSYIDRKKWQYDLNIKRDARGSLAEFIKSPWFGQIFISRTLPGITRGNHYHNVKTEKFLVVEGEGLIRFRPIDGTEILEFHVRGEDYQVLEIPPCYTHSITNIGKSEMITLFWASEIFDPDRPDTFFLPVDVT